MADTWSLNSIRHGVMNSLDKVEFMETFENIPENNLIISIFGFLRPPTIILGIPDYSYFHLYEKFKITHHFVGATYFWYHLICLKTSGLTFEFMSINMI